MKAKNLIMILNHHIKKYGEDLHVQLLDTYMDNEDATYPIEEESIEVIECNPYNKDGSPNEDTFIPVICIEFENHLQS